MKKVSIVYNQPLTQIQGINYVNNSFVVGGRYFKEHGLLLSKIYAPDTAFDCTTHDCLDLIGSNVGTNAYCRERKLRMFMRGLLSSKYLLGAGVKIFFNHTLNAKKAIKRLKNDDSDYLIFQDINSVLAYYKKYGRKDGVKSLLILHCSNHPLEQAMPIFPGYYRHTWLKNKAFKHCEEAMAMVDKVVYLSNHAAEVSPIDKNKKTYIFNGVEDLSDVRILPPFNPLQLVIVGSVTERKGQLNLVEALALLDKDTLKKVHLTIIGGGNEFEICQQLVKEKRLQNVVTMTGPRNDVAEILKGMDVFLLPSLSEGMPMSILEAMRQGLYIMASDTGGIAEMIGEGYGELITRNYQELANAIKYVADNGIVTLESKQKSRKRYTEDFTLKLMIDRYSKTLLSL